MPYVLKIDPQKPDAEQIQEVVRILQSGGVIAYPTETFFGLGCDSENEKAVERIYQVKGRLFTSPLSVIAGKMDDALNLIDEVTPSGQRLMDHFWPGPLTLIFKSSSRVLPRLTAHTGKIGIRISSHPLATLITNALSRPITATSANLTGARECLSAADVIENLGDRLDAIIDAGITPGGTGSTIIDVTIDPPALLREGVIPFAAVQNCLRQVNEK